MAKTEVLATSFILTLTVISTVPVQSVDLQYNFNFFSRQQSQRHKKKFGYDLASTTILGYNNYLTQEGITFSFSKTLTKFSTKIKQEFWNFNNLNLHFFLWRKANFRYTNPLKRLTQGKTVSELSFSFTSPTCSDILISKTTFIESKAKTFAQQKIGRAIEYQEAWTAKINNTDPSNTQPEVNIITEPLPVISLIITSLFCWLSPKKSQTSIDNTNSQNSLNT